MQTAVRDVYVDPAIADYIIRLVNATRTHPDVYLAAAAALAIAPQRCAVVEDTLTGAAAGLAAGATVFAYVPHGDAEPFHRAGVAAVFSDMALLPALLA